MYPENWRAKSSTAVCILYIFSVHELLCPIIFNPVSLKSCTEVQCGVEQCFIPLNSLIQAYNILKDAKCIASAPLEAIDSDKCLRNNTVPPER